jgi:hypothetical protein
MSVNDDDDDDDDDDDEDDDDDVNDDVGELLSMTSSASCMQIRTISFSKRKGNV